MTKGTDMADGQEIGGGGCVVGGGGGGFWVFCGWVCFLGEV